MKKVITAQDIQEARKAGLTAVCVPPGALITPQALDDARQYGIALQREGAASGAVQIGGAAVAVQSGQTGRQAVPGNASQGSQGHGDGTVAGSSSYAARESQAVRNLMAAVAVPAANTQSSASLPTPGTPSSTTQAAIPAGFVAELISRQVAQHLGNSADMARINAVVQDVLCEHGREHGLAASQSPVQSGSGAVLVRGSDALPAGESSRNACVGAVIVTDSLPPDAHGPGIGYMQFADSSFEWTFSTDEVLLVLAGELRLSGAGLDLKAGPGDALRLAAGLSCTLTATGCVSCVYSAWPK